MMQAIHRRTTFWFRLNFILGFVIAIYVAIPTSWWIDLRYVVVTDRYLGPALPANRILLVSRVLKQDFDGDYRVEEQRREPSGKWLTVAACVNVRSVRYTTEKELPEPVTAGWWSYGVCDALPVVPAMEDAELRLCTWHYVRPFFELPWLSKRSAPVCSPSYRGRLLPAAARL